LGVAILAALLSFAVLAIAAFPFGLFKDTIRERIETQLGTGVSIGLVERREFLSLTPTVVIHDIAIRQPSWAGRGDMLRANSIETKVPMLPLAMGNGWKPESIIAQGLVLSLVRDANGRANWEGKKRSQSDGDKGKGLSGLIIPNGRISLRDDKRSLAVAGTLVSDAKALRINADGRFHDAPVRVSLTGGRIAALVEDALYPAQLDLNSSLLKLQAKTVMRGALNFKSMSLDMQAAAPNLKYLDDVIEAGLFGTQPIDLNARVRHEGKDWFIERMTGRIGQSSLAAKAVVLKRDGRTKIDADVHFTRFSFDDLSDEQGQAEARAIEARIGSRILPGTRINISKVGPTDGVVRFRADRLLLQDSSFRSLAGVIRLDGKLLTIDKIVAGMTSGRMTGNLRIDQRNDVARPRLSIDLVLAGGRLETLMGTRAATGPLRARVKLAGTGDTIRAALANADGRAGLLVQGGTIKRTFAAVLGQDLGKAIGAALGDRDAEVTLRCLAIGFAAKRGVLTPAPFVVDTGISVGQGQGQLSLASERLALTIRGQARNPTALRLADPIVVGGTFTSPTVSAAGTPAGTKMDAGSVIKVIGKSVGRALGLGKDEREKPPLRAEDQCDEIARKIL
jgi:uncharacterized protein involved in outer membrane biogenesis